MPDFILPAVKTCKKCFIEKPLTDFGSRKDVRCGLRPVCKECQKSVNKAWRDNNPNRRKLYYAEHREEELSRMKKVDRTIFYKKNRSRLIECSLKWARENAGIMAARAMHRLALKRTATPSWADFVLIEGLYQESDRRSQETGIRWHVDHIVPLKSLLVCGLHVQDNLAVIPAAENIAKSNRYWPDMP